MRNEKLVTLSSNEKNLQFYNFKNVKADEKIFKKLDKSRNQKAKYLFVKFWLTQ